MQEDVAIKVEHVSKSFRLPHDKQTSIKGGLISLLKNGRRTYETQEVLKDVSFEIKKGEFFGIVGRNGSGKSTLLKMLAGIYQPTSGNITIDGSLTPFIELGVGFNPELTGRENVYLNGALLGFNRAEMDAMCDDIIEFAELERFMDQKLKNYSSGMQVRLAFSIAIRAQSDILLLDEVLAVGDAAFQQKCYDYFEQLKQDKRTVVLVTHDMGAVQRFCTRAMLVDRGKIKVYGEPDEVSAAYLFDNFAAPTTTTKGKNVSGAKRINKIAVTVEQSKKDSAKLIFDVQNHTGQSTYVGFSLIKDGVTVGEMNSMHASSNKILYMHSYNLDIRTLNPGRYEISATLFIRATKAPMAQTLSRASYILKGYDERRGGGIKLADDWEATS